jgi:hypothetical protein
VAGEISPLGRAPGMGAIGKTPDTVQHTANGLLPSATFTPAPLNNYTQTELRLIVDKITFVTGVTLVTQNSRLLLIACLPNQPHQEMLMRSNPGRLTAVDRCAALTTLST